MGPVMAGAFTGMLAGTAAVLTHNLWWMLVIVSVGVFNFAMGSQP